MFLWFELYLQFLVTYSTNLKHAAPLCQKTDGFVIFGTLGRKDNKVGYIFVSYNR